MKERCYLFLPHLVVVLGQPGFQSKLELNDLLSAWMMERKLPGLLTPLLFAKIRFALLVLLLMLLQLLPEIGDIHL